MNYLRINRERLGKFLPDEQTIRTFEELIKIVNEAHADFSILAADAWNAIHSQDSLLSYGISPDSPPFPVDDPEGTIYYDLQYIYVKFNDVLGWRKSSLNHIDADIRRPFRYAAILTAAAAGTPVHVLPAEQVDFTESPYLTQMIIRVNGATAWTDGTATVVKIQNTEGIPVVGVTIPKALLTGFSTTWLSTTGITLGSAVIANSSGNQFGFGEGLDIVADANFAAGSDIIVTLIGDILVS